MDGYGQLKNMSLDALAGVVDRYPWFGVARKIMCGKILEEGAQEWGMTQYSDAAMYVPFRGHIARMLRGQAKYQDKDVTEIIKRLLGPASAPEPALQVGTNTEFRGVGDYFSLEQYAMVRNREEENFGRFASAEGECAPIEIEPDFGGDYCTETLAQIYADQGYFQQAKDIYSKLILAYPEKNAYFAALIEKLDSEIKN